MATQIVQAGVIDDVEGSQAYTANNDVWVHPDDVPFEEYIYHAAVQRRAEEAGTTQQLHGIDTPPEKGTPQMLAAPPSKENWFNTLSEKKGPNVNLEQRLPANLEADDFTDLTPDQIERVNASRALRRATWASVFYLITTVRSFHLYTFCCYSCNRNLFVHFSGQDILGPFNSGYAISTVGWVPGIIL